MQGDLYVGNASTDQVHGTGWFIGQFIPMELGLRHQTAVEIKWGEHLDGEKRHRPWAQGQATTISILVRGTLNLKFHLNSGIEDLTLQRPGDYVIYGPSVVHSWEAKGETIALTIRFPSVPLNEREKCLFCDEDSGLSRSGSAVRRE